MRYLSSLLQHLPHLQTFSLTKGHQYLDHEPMLYTAQRIFRMNRGLPLQQVNVRWARERCANHLKQEGTYDVDIDSSTSKRTLLAWERGITLLGTTFERKFKAPIDKKQRWPGRGRTKGSALIDEYESRREEGKIVEVGEVGFLPDSND